jgi:hypothetical protein
LLSLLLLYLRCLCLAFASSHSAPQQGQSKASASGVDRSVQPAAQDKYERILAFVDAHTTPVVLDSSCSSSQHSTPLEQQQQFEDLAMSSWHHSYDEEAEEGEELHEPCVMAFAAAVPAAVAESAAAAAAFTSAGPSWSYGNSISPKPFFYAWDEEAEGAFELEPACSSSACDVAAAVPADPVAAAAALRAQRRAALHEARHAARATRRMRRSQLHPQLGDLEHMQAWVQPKEQQQQQGRSRPRSAPGIQYQQLLALVAGDSAARQYRHPKHWHLTFDEDVHGPEAPETVLGSC